MAKLLDSFFRKHNKKKSSVCALQVESLKERQMLSTVSVFAQGSTGDEMIGIDFRSRQVAVIDSLPTDGFQELQFSQGGFGGVADTTLSEIDAQVQGDVVDFELQIDGQTVREYSLLSRGVARQTFVYRAQGSTA